MPVDNNNKHGIQVQQKLDKIMVQVMANSNNSNSMVASNNNMVASNNNTVDSNNMEVTNKNNNNQVNSKVFRQEQGKKE